MKYKAKAKAKSPNRSHKPRAAPQPKEAKMNSIQTAIHRAWQQSLIGMMQGGDDR